MEYSVKDFCNPGCRASYGEDRMRRMVYPPWKVDGKMIGHVEACKQLRLCIYCQSKLEKKPVRRKKK